MTATLVPSPLAPRPSPLFFCFSAFSAISAVILLLVLLAACAHHTPTPITPLPPPPPPIVVPPEPEVPPYVLAEHPGAKILIERGWLIYYDAPEGVLVDEAVLRGKFNQALDKVQTKMAKVIAPGELLVVYVAPNCTNLNGKAGICVEPYSSEPACVSYMQAHYPWSLSTDGRCVYNGITPLLNFPITSWINSDIRDERHEWMHALWWLADPGRVCPGSGAASFDYQAAYVEHGFGCDPFLGGPQ